MQTVELGIEGIGPARIIAGGGSATVYGARQDDGSLVAVKVMNASVGTEAARRSFEKEREALDRLPEHPNIVEIIGSGMTDRGEPYLLMPLMAGSLRDHIEHNGPTHWHEAALLVAKASDAVALAHAYDVLHRDLKPANILIDNDGEPRVADFGIAKLTDARTSTMSGLLFTLGFAPPERLQGIPASIAGDVYGLTATLYALIAGFSPFATDGVSTEAALQQILHEDPAPLTVDDLPPSLVELLDRGLSKKPELRPSGPAALAVSLRRCIETHASDSLPSRTVQTPGAATHQGFDRVRAPMVSSPAIIDDESMDKSVDMEQPHVVTAGAMPASDGGTGSVTSGQQPSLAQSPLARFRSTRTITLAAGGALLGISTLMPWMTGPDGSINGFDDGPWTLTGGKITSGEGLEGLLLGFSVGPTVLAHGWIFLAFALVVLALALWPRPLRLGRWGALGVGVAGAALAIANYFSFTTSVDDLTNQLGSSLLGQGLGFDLSLSIGIYAAFVASLIIVVGALLPGRDRSAV